jgi:hypothetical protein
MEKLDFTDDQLLRLINNTIISKTEFTVDEYTGGSIQITSTNNHTVTNFKASLFFGYKNKKPVSRTITISKDMFYIWAKALLLKTISIKNDNLGMNYSELNKLMNTDYLTRNSNSIVGVGLQVGLPQKETKETYEEYVEKCEKLSEQLLQMQINKDKLKMRLDELSEQDKNNEIKE